MNIIFNEINKPITQTNSTWKTLLENVYYGSLITGETGEGLAIQSISSPTELFKKIGDYTTTNYKEWVGCESFLNYSDKLKIVRVVSRNVANKLNEYTDNNPPTAGEILNFYNSTKANPNLIQTDRIGIVEKYTSQNENISIAICSTESAWNQEISNERLNLVQSRRLTTPPTSPKEGDMYLVPAGATGDWSGQTNKYAIWLRENDAWNFVSVISNDVVFIVDENLEYVYISPDWIQQEDYYNQFDHIKYKNESAYRVVYGESLQNSFGKILKFNQLYLTKPNFTAGDFCLLILKQSSFTNKFSIVEKHLLNYSTAMDIINFKSNYIYIKINTIDYPNVKIDTNSYSIVDGRLKQFTNTNLSPDVNDYNTAIDLLKTDPQVMVIADMEFGNEMNFITNKLNGTSKLLLTGCYDSSKYSSVTTVVTDFGTDRTNGYWNIIGYKNCCIMASMAYNSMLNKYIPWYGEFAGQLFQNLNNNIIAIAGYRFGKIENKAKTLNIMVNSTNASLLNHNFINNISWDSEVGSNIIQNDLVNDPDNNISVAYYLLFNAVETELNSYFTSYNIKCPRLKETEKLKALLEKKIAEYGIDGNVSYTVTTTTEGYDIAYTIGLVAGQLIKEIIVNITIV